MVGYVVMKEGAEAGVVELREHLRQRVPAYMVPSVWVWMDELPMTPSGKVGQTPPCQRLRMVSAGQNGRGVAPRALSKR